MDYRSLGNKPVKNRFQCPVGTGISILIPVDLID